MATHQPARSDGAAISNIIDRQAPGVKRICPQCGVAFTPATGKQVFCVRACQQRHAYYEFRVLHEKTCAAPGCRRTFTITDPRRPKVAGPKDRRYCSDDCESAGYKASPAGQASYQRWLAKAREERARPRRQDRCDHCARDLDGKQWSARFCDRECEKAFNRLPREHPTCLARDCDEPITTGRPHRKWHSDRCGDRERRHRRRDALRKAAAA